MGRRIDIALLAENRLKYAAGLPLDEFAKLGFEYWCAEGYLHASNSLVRRECFHWLEVWGLNPGCQQAVEGFRETRASHVVEWSTRTWLRLQERYPVGTRR